MILSLAEKTYGTPGKDPWVRVSAEGNILVLSGHSLSNYSKAIYGDFNHLSEFFRLAPDGSVLEIVNKNLIHIGETIVWKPQYDHHRKMTGARSGDTYTLPPKGASSLRGAEIIALDPAYSWSEPAGLFEAIATFGEVHFTDVKSFASNVLNAAGASKIGVLHVQVHGRQANGVLMFGSSDNVHHGSFHYYRPHFQKLAGKFLSDAWVFFRACYGGQQHILLRQFRDLWQCNVISGISTQRNLPGIADFNMQGYYVVEAGGAEYTTQTLPGGLRHSNVRRMVRPLAGD